MQISLPKPLTAPRKRHGLIFDFLFFLINLVLPVGTLISFENPIGWQISALLGIAVVGQWIGAWLKQRWRPARGPGFRWSDGGLAGWFMRGLLLFHFLLFWVSGVMVLALLELYTLDNSQDLAAADWWLVLTAATAAGVTWTVYRAGRGRNKGDEVRQAQMVSNWGEWVADCLLWLSVVCLTRLYWGMLVDLLQPAAGSGLNGSSLVLLGASSFLFLFFYLPGRYLYFVEDYRSPLTWLQVWVAILPVYQLILWG